MDVPQQHHHTGTPKATNGKQGESKEIVQSIRFDWLVRCSGCWFISFLILALLICCILKFLSLPLLISPLTIPNRIPSLFTFFTSKETSTYQKNGQVPGKLSSRHHSMVTSTPPHCTPCLAPRRYPCIYWLLKHKRSPEVGLPRQHAGSSCRLAQSPFTMFL